MYLFILQRRTERFLTFIIIYCSKDFALTSCAGMTCHARRELFASKLKIVLINFKQKVNFLSFKYI